MRYSLVFLLGLFVISLAVARAEFRAAVVKVDITPTTPQWLMGYGPRQSTGVRDKIYHRIAALDDGGTQTFIVASDLCLFSPTVYDDVTATLKKELGLALVDCHAQSFDARGRSAWDV